MSTIPFDQRDGWIWLDGEFVPWKEATVNVINHGLHYGSSVFEGMRMYNGKIFKNREHMERLALSAKMLDMDQDIEIDIEGWMKAAIETCEKNNLHDAYIRPIIWRGSEGMGVDARVAKPHMAIAAWSWGKYFSGGADGISLITAPWKKAPPSCTPYQAKCGGLYVTNSLNKHYAVDKGYTDVVVLDWRGQVAESSGANIFAVIDGVLKTPVADCFLNGITRQTALELAPIIGVTAEECVLMLEDLEKASEVFVTGTAAEITPVSKINETEYKVGPVTLAMQEAYVKATH
ncbi:MAG: branched-chain amino acid aminotransferase [Micavibrio sp.]|nr:branched-chain amino acid aminotransferase [Micavibrio sp.]